MLKIPFCDTISVMNTETQDREQYRHKKQKGCSVHLIRKEYIGKNMIKIFLCETHGVETCRCGMEWGKHQV